MTTPKPLARSASTPPHPASPLVILGLAGGSGAGKTWLATELVRLLRPHAGILSLDDFYRDLGALPTSRRDRVNFDTPDAIDWELLDACLDRIRSGRPVAIPRYDFTTHSRLDPPRRWTPKPIVVVEGLWPWTRRPQQRHYNLRLYIDAPTDLRLTRRLARDVAERGRTPASIRRQWREAVEPMFTKHVKPQALTADAILGPEPCPDDLSPLINLIRQLAGLPPAAHP
jgi:uridine kinase